MADIVHARDALSGGKSSASPNRSGSTAESPSPNHPQGKPPRTDVGTLVLHWATAIAFVVSLFTGIRIAADALSAPVSHWLTPILPQGEIWTWHFLSGLVLFFCAAAYFIYMRRSGLANRNALKKSRMMLMKTTNRNRFGGLNVALHWAAYAIIVIMTVTGVLLYLGHGGWLVSVHSYVAFIGLGYILVHIAAHYLFGGWWQVFRVFCPAQLLITEAVKPKPLLIAALVGVAAAAAAAGIDWADRDTVTIARVKDAPKLDGVLDDAVWRNAKPVKIETQQGVGLAGTGASTVWARAVHDGSKVYFAFQWTDPSRSMRRIPMIKKEDGWYLLHDGADIADVNTFYEDKLSIVFSDNSDLGGGGVTHLGSKPLADKTAPLHKRGYHYTTDNSIVDMWQWKASRGGHLGYVDDQYIGPPRDMTPGEAAGKARYQAGYWNDPGRAFYSYNYAGEPPGGYRGPAKMQRLPKDWKAVNAALGKFDLNPDSNDEEGSKWWMTEDETVPYSKELDAAIPVGTVLPGVLIMGNYEGDRAHVRGAAKWKDGMWTLETVRDLKTGSKFDKDFVPGTPLYMWVAVFDHTQTRHTRHHRAVRIMTQD
jgi:cytochrome b subunit of formate dehydrogenase